MQPYGLFNEAVRVYRQRHPLISLVKIMETGRMPILRHIFAGESLSGELNSPVRATTNGTAEDFSL